ncbi:MAG TPA: hypothetical protein VI636_22450 [Candidatus Angelobacter sp.]
MEARPAPPVYRPIPVASGVQQAPRSVLNGRSGAAYSDGVRPKNAAFDHASAKRFVQRKMLSQTGFIKNKHLAKQLVEDFNCSLGYTPPHLNNLVVQDSTKAADFALALKPPTVTVKQIGETEFAATVEEVPTNYVGYLMYLPMPGPWVANATQIPQTISFMSLGLNAEHVNQLKVKVTGLKGNDETLEQQVKKHEEVHAADIRRLIDKIFVPWDNKLTKAKEKQIAFKGATAEEACKNLYEAVGGTPKEIAEAFFVAAEKSSDEFHQSGKGKTDFKKPIVEQQTENSYRATVVFYLSI